MKKKFSLRFSNPVFHEGLNTTVRLGDRLDELPEPGGEFLIEGTKNKGKLIFKVLRLSGDITMEELLCEHDIACQNPVTLLDALGIINTEGNMIELVTVVGFVVV